MEPLELLARRALIPIVANAGPRCPRCGVRLLATETKACPRCKVDPSSRAAAERLVPGGSFVREFFRGASYVPRGAVKIITTPKLWAVSALPLVLNVAIFLLVYYVILRFLVGSLEHYASPEATKTWTGVGWWIVGTVLWALGNLVASTVFKVVVIPLLLAWLMGAFPLSVILRTIFAPLATMVGERTEQVTLGLDAANEGFHLGALQASLVITIVDSLLLGVLEGVLYLLLSPINVIPFVGSILWMALPPAIFAGMNHSDPNFCRKNYYMRERVALWSLRKWRFLGFGCCFFFLLGIPFVNAVIFPVVACGSALMYLELDRK
jgi:uncharacterized protein involved in cysteine biosynthesis